MPFSIQQRYEDNLIYIKVTEKFSADQYDQIMDQVVSDTSISLHAHTLWDLTDMDFKSVHTDFLKKVITHRKKYDKKRGKNTKAAIVANSDLGFGVSRQYAALSIEFSQKMQIFRTVEDAMAWLNET